MDTYLVVSGIIYQTEILYIIYKKCTTSSTNNNNKCTTRLLLQILKMLFGNKLVPLKVLPV